MNEQDSYGTWRGTVSRKKKFQNFNDLIYQIKQLSVDDGWPTPVLIQIQVSIGSLGFISA